MSEIFDIIILGAGPGGYQSAIRAAQHGAKVAIIEKNHFGGICTNYGCIPTKALYSSAILLEAINEKSSELGINITGSIGVNFPKAVERKNQIVRDSREGIKKLIETRKISVFKGLGKIEGGNSVSNFSVSCTNNDGNKTTLNGKRIIIATGTKSAQTHLFNIDHQQILVVEDIMHADFTALPKSLIIIGGDYMSCELAFIFCRFGCKVTLIEHNPSILTAIDEVIIKLIEAKFEEIGIKIYTNQTILKIDGIKNKARVSTYDSRIPRTEVESAEVSEFEAEYCLVAGGRRGNVNDIGFDGKTKRDRIIVDNTMETSIKGIYSIGDVNNRGYRLANVASYEGEIAVTNILARIGNFGVTPKKADYTIIPNVIFTSPEIGSVGISRRDEIAAAKVKGITVYSGRFFYSSFSKGHSLDIDKGQEGFVKLIADKETDVILGCSCIGNEASQLIADVALAMKNGITATKLSDLLQSPLTLFQLLLEKSPG